MDELAEFIRGCGLIPTLSAHKTWSDRMIPLNINRENFTSCDESTSFEEPFTAPLFSGTMRNSWKDDTLRLKCVSLDRNLAKC